MPRSSRIALASLAILAACGCTAPLQAQEADSIVLRGLELESAGRIREAASAYREGLAGRDITGALLGLERTYVELGWSDSLLAPIEVLIARRPSDSMVRMVQLRTLQSLGREAELRAAFEGWVRVQPREATPYREYARLLLQRGRSSTADSVLRRARVALGGTGKLELELAQLRAAQGQWVASAEAWRVALREQPYLEQAASHALAPTPAGSRDDVRAIFLAPPVEGPARLALAGLEAAWGSPADGWRALRDLPADSASAAAWAEFGGRMEGEERWALAYEALGAALRVRPSGPLAFRTATAALNAGDAVATLRLAPIPAGRDSASASEGLVSLHVQALARLGRAAAAEELVERMDRWLTPGERSSLARVVAFGWVRAGDMDRARRALSAAGVDGDSSDASGWLALYGGDIRSARTLLRGGTERTPELASALAVIARLRVDSAPAVGHAFLLLARRDSAGAAAALARAAQAHADAASVLLVMAAQVHAARGELPQAETLWRRVVEQHEGSAEAPLASLDWARALAARGDKPGAIARLEHLILTYPQSALVPQARRELELLRGAIPGVP